MGETPGGRAGLCWLWSSWDSPAPEVEKQWSLAPGTACSLPLWGASVRDRRGVSKVPLISGVNPCRASGLNGGGPAAHLPSPSPHLPLPSPTYPHLLPPPPPSPYFPPTFPLPSPHLPPPFPISPHLPPPPPTSPHLLPPPPPSSTFPHPPPPSCGPSPAVPVTSPGTGRGRRSCRGRQVISGLEGGSEGG